MVAFSLASKHHQQTLHFFFREMTKGKEVWYYLLYKNEIVGSLLSSFAVLPSLPFRWGTRWQRKWKLPRPSKRGRTSLKLQQRNLIGGCTLTLLKPNLDTTIQLGMVHTKCKLHLTSFLCRLLLVNNCIRTSPLNLAAGDLSHMILSFFSAFQSALTFWCSLALLSPSSCFKKGLDTQFCLTSNCIAL